MAPLHDAGLEREAPSDEGKIDELFMSQKTMPRDIFSQLAATASTSSLALSSHHLPLSNSLTTPSLGSSLSSMTANSIPPSPGSPGKRPRKRQRLDVGDRFVPTRELEESQRAFHLMDEEYLPSTSRTNRIIPHESDAAREQANSTFSTMLSKELQDDLPSRPSSPTRVGSAHSITPSTPNRKRVFSFHSPAKSNPGTPRHAGRDTPLSQAYSSSPVKHETAEFLTSPQRRLRSVCKTPFRVLDAPDLTDDFYLNLVDWSSTNMLGVGLGPCVYLWSARTAQVHKLCDLGQNDHLTSLCWVQKGSTLALGTYSGQVQIWDAESCKRLRAYQAHGSRVGTLAWHESVITSGSRDRTIQHRDVRAPGKEFKTLTAHRQEVCGLKWNSSIGQLASGGNDNKLMVWEHRGKSDLPLFKWHEHSAAVKAIAWNPHQPGVLVSGGGTQDKKMRFWNTMSGSLLAEVDTGSQVCNLIWSKNSQEVVSTHGYSQTSGQNQICIWKYPSMDMVATLSGHTHRVLYLAMSPDGQTIVTGAGDETLRFWNAFPKSKDEGKRRESLAFEPMGQIR